MRGNPRFGRLIGVVVAVITVGSVNAASASAADLYVSTTGSDSGACTVAAPCKSLGRAYAVAGPGQVVQVAAGTYGGQNIAYDASKTSEADVVIEAAPGTRPVLGGLSVYGRHVTVRGLKTGWVDVKNGNGQNVTDVTVVDGEGSGLFIGGGSSRISIIGGSYGGGAHNVAPVKIQGSPAPSDILVDGVTFHDAIRDACGAAGTCTNGTGPAHLECVYAADVQRFTVRNSRFLNCAIMDLFITRLSGVDPRDVLIENNFFDRTGSHAGAEQSSSQGYYSLNVAPHLTQAVNFTIRNNSFYQPFIVEPTTVSNFVVSGNIAPQSNCHSGLAYDHNVFTGVTCSATDKKAASGFKDPANYDFHLAAGAPAIDAANPANSPGRDIDADARPAGRAPDAGADETGSAPAPAPAPSPTPTPTPTPAPTPAPAPDRQAPTVPQGMAFATITKTSIGLRWSASRDNVGVTGYRLYRDGVRVATTTGTTSTFAGLKCNTRYTIGLTAVDAAGNESNRAEATGVTTTKPC